MMVGDLIDALQPFRGRGDDVRVKIADGLILEDIYAIETTAEGPVILLNSWLNGSWDDDSVRV